ncbi:hypothetical protein Tco_1018503 [Tanacetum coccineum]|uniref:Uncharacterized protein n=1 Tax=Tanacetum coccineum TaxID=301880 RepID=A0ABQ5FVX0_9ASTR
MNDCFNAESDLIESLLNQDTSIDSFHEIDSLFDEFANKLILLKPNSPEINNSDFDPKGEIRLLEMALHNYISTPSSEELFYQVILSISIPVRLVKLFYEERHISYFRYSTPPEYNHFTFDIEPDTAVKNDFDELNKDECFDLGGGEIDVFANVEDDDYFPFIFVIRIFLPYLTYPEVSPLPLSTRE